ncbi:MAG TPA: ureidoglycolate lyase [Stellaceae bacterium]|nr:ureidoglycolate lyase [Stellaceae bacterium]
MTRRLSLEPITVEAFAPFGQLLLPPKLGHGRLELVEDLQNGRKSARPRLSFATVQPKVLPLMAVEMERHVHSSQAFMPLDCASYLVLVAPHGADGLPDIDGLRAFMIPGDTGINYRADTWHHPLSALERVARFAIFMFVDDTAADEQFLPLPEQVMIEG